VVREGAYEVDRRRTLVLFPGRHSVEQVAGTVGAASERETIREREAARVEILGWERDGCFVAASPHLI
jgi:hypothetical protein